MMVRVTYDDDKSQIIVNIVIDDDIDTDDDIIIDTDDYSFSYPKQEQRGTPHSVCCKQLFSV